ncbi:MAG: hypothetical protein IPK85_21740 [Gemmatimonadetes bacterium]|nr:hypothetical protein [Gemmatimonadota bacterium]
MKGMMMHFALGAALVHGLGKPVAYRYPTDAETVKKGQTVVQVENTAVNEAVVYAVQGLRRQRLGMVHGLSVTKFSIPRDMVVGGQQVRFVVDAIGVREDGVSDAITVAQGERVNLFIPPF